LTIKSATGILANNAEDLQFLDIMNFATGISLNTIPLKSFKNIDFSKMKIGYFLTDGIFEPMAAIKNSILKSVDYLESLGVSTIPFQPPNLLEAEEIYTKILSADRMPIFRNNLKDDQLIKLLKGYFMLSSCPESMRKILTKLAGMVGQRTLKRVLPFFGGKGKLNMMNLKKRKMSFTKSYYCNE